MQLQLLVSVSFDADSYYYEFEACLFVLFLVGTNVGNASSRRRKCAV